MGYPNTGYTSKIALSNRESLCPRISWGLLLGVPICMLHILSTNVVPQLRCFNNFDNIDLSCLFYPLLQDLVPHCETFSHQDETILNPLAFKENSNFRLVETSRTNLKRVMTFEKDDFCCVWKRESWWIWKQLKHECY